MVESEKLVQIQILDTPNGNGRTYPRSVMESAITGKPVRGMIGMPNAGDWLRWNDSKTTHEVTELHIEGDRLMGTVRTLDTERGRIVAANLDIYDFRIAGFANVSDDGIILDLKIHSINAVLDGA
jgi:hypothetical protein